MIPTTTYPPPPPRYDYGGYRYFFNGQESDGEVYGQGGLASYEFRQYDTRLGRWWGIDRKVAKYPSLSPYQFCAGNPVWMKDVDGSDFVVTIENTASGKIITIQMDVYTTSQTAYNQLLPAVAEINSITRKVTIDDVEYTLYFEINPVPPESRDAAAQNAANGGFWGNYFEEADLSKEPEPAIEEGKTGYYGGKTVGKHSWMLPGPDGLDFGNCPQLVGHELLHLLGLSDEGGEFYAPGGRMEYIATPYNDFEMYDITNDDIKNILRFAFLFDGSSYKTHAVKIDYCDDNASIRQEPNIEIK